MSLAVRALPFATQVVRHVRHIYIPSQTQVAGLVDQETPSVPGLDADIKKRASQLNLLHPHGWYPESNERKKPEAVVSIQQYVQRALDNIPSDYSPCIIGIGNASLHAVAPFLNLPLKAMFTLDYDERLLTYMARKTLLLRQSPFFRDFRADCLHHYSGIKYREREIVTSNFDLDHGSDSPMSLVKLESFRRAQRYFSRVPHYVVPFDATCEGSSTWFSNLLHRHRLWVVYSNFTNVHGHHRDCHTLVDHLLTLPGVVDSPVITSRFQPYTGLTCFAHFSGRHYKLAQRKP